MSDKNGSDLYTYMHIYTRRSIGECQNRHLSKSQAEGQVERTRDRETHRLDVKIEHRQRPENLAVSLSPCLENFAGHHFAKWHTHHPLFQLCLFIILYLTCSSNVELSRTRVFRPTENMQTEHGIRFSFSEVHDTKNIFPRLKPVYDYFTLCKFFTPA